MARAQIDHYAALASATAKSASSSMTMTRSLPILRRLIVDRRLKMASMAPSRSAALLAAVILVPVSSVGAWKVGPFGSEGEKSDTAPLPKAADPPVPASDTPTFGFSGSVANPSPEEAILPSKVASPLSSPSVTRAPYNGLEYRAGNLVFRPGQLKIEGALLVGLFAVIFIAFSGRRANRSRATALWKAQLPLLHQEYAQVGTDAPDALTADGAQEYYGYATGRRGCSGVTIKIDLRPRQDPTMWLVEEAWSILDATWTGKGDWVEIEWKLLPGSAAQATAAAAMGGGAFDAKDAWVFAIVNKRGMNATRRGRWDIRTFTDTKESPLLPPQFVLMTESGDITDALFKRKETGLVDLITSKAEVLTYLDSLTISGTRRDEPEDSELPLPAAPKSRTITMRLRLPPASKSSTLTPLLSVGHSLVDALPTLSIPSVSASKIPKRRAEVSDALMAETKKEQAEAKEEARRKKQKEREEEKKKGMSAGQLEKMAQLEKKRQQTKSQSKMAVKRK